MKQILISAFSCDPYKGSESAIGWNWAVGLVHKGYEVHCLTRMENRNNIQNFPDIENLHFYYIKLSFGLEKLYEFSTISMYLYYMIWQWKAYLKGKKLLSKIKFFRVQHVSWGSIQQGSFLYKLDVPFIFGPSGGGQVAPVILKDYFLNGWLKEVMREKVSKILFRFNPACKNMLRKAYAVLVSNTETEISARLAGASIIYHTFDMAVPEPFFPSGFVERKIKPNQLKLLWVGRILPRKGLLLVLDVMKELEEFPQISLTIVGDGEMRAFAEKKSIDLGLQKKVTFVGLVPYNLVREYYESHDLLFLTSLRDSGPGQLIEALAFNLPVITLDLHGQGEIITAETGVKVKIDEPARIIKELAKAIIDLSNDPLRYASMCHAAYNFGHQQVWSKKIDDVVEKFYH
ncbi:MAG: glycosyltransferase family 4 protein [Bacteroidota bacterium]|nr:glycosyltransferase family 4 protein [Bacteroidota bacterium]